jgi:hypothetical protein
MNFLALLTLIVITPLLWGCNRPEVPTGKIYSQRGGKLYQAGDYAAAAEEYHKGVLLGSAVCRRGEMISLILASGGTNTIYLAKAKASMHLAVSHGDHSEEAYLSWLRYVGAEHWEETLKLEP